MSFSARDLRLSKELKKMAIRPPWGISCRPFEDRLDYLKVNLLGPKGSPYEGGLFQLDVQVSERYPFEAPVVRFTTPMYHPNIDEDGRICLDLLKMPPSGAWLPTVTLESLLIAIQTLLANPNPDHPLMTEAANEYKSNYKEFEKKVRKHVEMNALKSQAGSKTNESKKK